MSGPKTGHISLTPSARFDRQCTALEKWLANQEQVPALDDIEAELRDSRTEARALRDAPTPPMASLLNAAEVHREQLSLYVNQHRSQWAAAATAVDRLQAELQVARQRVASRQNFDDWDGETQAIRAAGAAAKKALQSIQPERRQFDVLHRELALVRKKLTNAPSSRTLSSDPKRTPAASAQTPEFDLAEIRRTARAAAIEQNLGSLAATEAADAAQIKSWLVDAQRWTDYQNLLAQSRDQLSRGAVEEAEKSVAAAFSAVHALRQEAAANLEAADRNERIADAIMQALCDRNYNTPSYGELKQGDPLAGIQIRADVPNRDGKGNLRIDIHLDGRTVFEVENVAEGEESICKDVIHGVGEAIAGAGLVLEMKDWGRANGSKNKTTSIRPQPTAERVSEREGNRSR